jgi:hypothetical protein
MPGIHELTSVSGAANVSYPSQIIGMWVGVPNIKATIIQ